MIATSSAYEALYIFDGGVEMSCMYNLKSVGDMTDPCGTVQYVTWACIKRVLVWLKGS